jgi:hypothetical protein
VGGCIWHVSIGWTAVESTTIGVVGERLLRVLRGGLSTFSDGVSSKLVTGGKDLRLG